MGKVARQRSLPDTDARVISRAIRISPRKLDIVIGLIRGKNVAKAMQDLAFNNRRIAGEVQKALRSALANGENNHQLDVDRLYVREAWVGKGLVMKRFRARARGRAGRVTKAFSNLTIVVREAGEST